MPIEITIPRLGWSMEEGTFVEWLKRDGDAVAPGEPLFVLEGEKALQEIEAVDAGTLHLHAQSPAPGTVVQVGTVIGYLLGENESPPALNAAAPQPALAQQPEIPAALKPASVSAVGVPRAVEPSLDLPRVAASQIRARHADPSLPEISPRAARTAKVQGVDWTQLHGSGRTGRIRERDVLLPVPHRPASAAAEPLPDVPGTLRPASPLRRTIAQRLEAVAHRTVPVTLTTKVNAGNLVAWRRELKQSASGMVPSYHDLILSCAAKSLAACPELNACWFDRGIYLYEEVNLAFAVETEAGLLAPVIHRADALTLAQLSEQAKSLAEQARAGRLTPAQLSGGTFTVTNLGMFDIDGFTPVLNQHQSAILGVGRIVEEPVVVNHVVVAGFTLMLSLTFDHRVLDGAHAARWLQHLSRQLQQPA